jgi:glutathione S-transferase
MKLYYARGACSLSDRIALHEAGIPFVQERVDLASGLTETGRNFRELNPKGYVPLLVLDDGRTLTENVAVLSLIADHAPHLQPEGDLGRIRLLEALSFISSELHVAFKPLFRESGQTRREAALNRIAGLLQVLAGQVRGDFLLGGRFTVADAYLFVVLRWAGQFGIVVPARLTDHFRRVEARPLVRQSLREEALPPAAAIGRIGSGLAAGALGEVLRSARAARAR